MGRVYLATGPDGEQVAVKVVRPDFADDTEFRLRFRHEVAAARRVHGRFTAEVVAADVDGERPWLATEYVPGPSLRDAVAERGPMPPDAVLLLAAGLAEALRAVHDAGLVHRDLKPGNVLLADDGARVIDFGIARAADDTNLTTTGVHIGSPRFTAPEQAVGRPVSAATDVFSLGMVLAFAATGRTPFGDGDAHILLYRVAHEPPDLSDLPRELHPLVTACLAKDPAKRPTLDEVVRLCGVTGSEDWLAEAITERVRDRLPVWSADTIGTVRSRRRHGLAALLAVALVIVLSWSDRGPTATNPRAGLVLSGASAPLVFSPDGKVLATAGDGAVRLWDTATGSLVRELRGLSPAGAGYLAFRQDSRFLIAGDLGGHVLVWDVATGRRTASVAVGGQNSVVAVGFTTHMHAALASGTAGRALALVLLAPGSGPTSPQNLEMWDVTAGKRLVTFSQVGNRGHQYTFTPDAHVVVVAGSHAVTLWDAGNQRQITSLAVEGGESWILALSGDGQFLVTGEASLDDRTGDLTVNPLVMIRDLVNLRRVTMLPVTDHAKVPEVAAFSQDGRVIATTAEPPGDYVALWDATRPAPVPLATVAGPAARAASDVALSPDGRRLAASSDSEVRLWDISARVADVPAPAAGPFAPR
nr:serine/threonine protein kinase [uncultured bacterium]